jgi:hypothetical protein
MYDNKEIEYNEGKQIFLLVIISCVFTRCRFTHPKVAGAEFRTSGGTYAAVPTNVQALSAVHKRWENKNYKAGNSEFYNDSGQLMLCLTS